MLMTIEPFTISRTFTIPSNHRKHSEDVLNIPINYNIIPIEEQENQEPDTTTKASVSESPSPIYEAEDVFEIRPTNEFTNHMAGRLKYLQKLVQQRIWLNPLQQPKSS